MTPWSRQSVFVSMAVGLFLLQLPVLAWLNETEVAQHKTERDPYAREVSLPAEHLANYLLGTIAGGLDQIIVNSLWMQYEGLKNENRYDEAVAILGALALLQPDHEQTWHHLGWDISYNISNRQPDRNEEWKKIQEGIDLYREGLRRMPRSDDLYLGLARVYHHRIPQEKEFVDRVWMNNRQEGEQKTTYRHAADVLLQGRDRLDKDRDAYRYYQYAGYPHAAQSLHENVTTLIRYGEYEKARAAIEPARERIHELFEERGDVPNVIKMRLEILPAMGRIIELDQTLNEIEWDTTEKREENSEEKISATRTLLEEFGHLFQEHPIGPDRALPRLAISRLFELLYYVDRDFHRYYREGREEARESGRTLVETMQSLVAGLTLEDRLVGEGYPDRADADLGEFLQALDQYYQSIDLHRYRSRQLQQQMDQETERQIRSEIHDLERRLEEVYVTFVDLYHASHWGFKKPFLHRNYETPWWMDQRLTSLRSTLDYEE